MLRLKTVPPACVLALGVAVAGSGCALQRYDAKTGTQHLWGFGHLALKTPPPDAELPAAVTEVETFGLNGGTTVGGGHLALGWRAERWILVNASNASVRLEWPRGDVFTVRMGRKPPFPWKPQPASSGTSPSPPP